jgi:hypothetical protein
METPRPDVYLGFTQTKYPAGTHMCFIYDSESDRDRTMAQFLIAGIERGERVAYFADREMEKVSEWLAAAGLATATDSVTGEMAWALRDLPGSERLIEYEAKVNNVLPGTGLTAICQYDAARWDGGTILNVLRVHPMMVVRGHVLQNPYYMSPEEYLARHGASQGI